MPMPTLTPAEADAISRFERGVERPQIEAWYLKVSLGGGRALQLRIGLLQRMIGKREARAEVWAAATGLGDDAQEHTVLRTRHPMSDVRIEPEILYVRVGEVELTHGQTRGEIQDPEGPDVIRWKLEFTRQPEGFRHLPHPWMYRSALVPAKACSPQVDARFKGTIEVGGRSVEVSDAPGLLTHHWGSDLSDGWVWAHCNRWHGSEEIVFEGASTRPRLGALPIPTVTTLHLRLPGERMSMNGLVQMVRAKTRTNGLSWRVSGSRGDRRVEATFQATADRFVGVDHQAPDGRVLHVVTSAVADGAITISGKHGRGWTQLMTAVADQTACLQLGTRGDTFGVPITLR
jgi:hypothetical protein